MAGFGCARPEGAVQDDGRPEGRNGSESGSEVSGTDNVMAVSVCDAP